ncbi:MAG: DUF4198 domain-containing protein [Rhizobiaceae bacterium]
MQLVSPIIALTIIAALIFPAKSHELWISPEKYLVSSDEPITAHIRIGERFEGPSYPFVEMNFNRFEIAGGSQTEAVTGRIGDSPALNQKAGQPGLNVIVYETTANFVTYSDFEKFRNFVTHKGYPGIIDRHNQLGLPQTGFKERYFRYAKSLVGVENGAGEDREFGLETEIVVLKNPYSSDLSNSLPVQIFYQGEPRTNAQVEVFERALVTNDANRKETENGVKISVYQADSDGKATIPVRQGHEYLIDSVIIRPVIPTEDKEKGSNSPVWESLWASMTLEIPLADQ